MREPSREMRKRREILLVVPVTHPRLFEVFDVTLEVTSNACVVPKAEHSHTCTRNRYSNNKCFKCRTVQ